MTKPKSIAQLLAELVVQGNMPLKAVAVAGELIAMDARISDYPNGPMKSNSLQEIERVAESYDALTKEVEAIKQEYLGAKDRQALMNGLAAVKEMMTALL